MEQLLAHLVLVAHITTHSLHEHGMRVLLDYHLAIMDLDQILLGWHLLQIALGASTIGSTDQLAFPNAVFALASGVTATIVW